MDLITLPPLERETRVSSGRVLQVLAAAERVEVEAEATVQVSPRVSESCLVLADGRKILLTARRHLSVPAGVWGALRTLPSGEQVWLEHPARADPPIRDDVVASWRGALQLIPEERDDDGAVTKPGLRPPQIGALHAIGAHWTLETEPATVVMPTGTGKTEVMVAAQVRFLEGRTLVLVPSTALRVQLAHKFANLGVLPQVQCLAASALRPIVGLVEQSPKTESDLSELLACNVVVATVQAVTALARRGLMKALAAMFDNLILDEAHHVRAPTWSAVRKAFREARVLQFTATPYRRDDKPVDGRQIFNYPLGRAQRDGYFRPINFVAVEEGGQDVGDREVARRAIAALRSDLQNGLDHLLMARCKSIGRARSLADLYCSMAPDLEPVAVHSKLTAPLMKQALDSISERRARVLVCVDMFGEGYDLPELKVAAVHDLHMSLPVLLQFVGRFTRDKPGLGSATVVANVAIPNVPAALDQLYDRDSDWDEVLRESASQAMSRRQKALEYFANTKPLPGLEANPSGVRIPYRLLRPALSATVFSASRFTPEAVVDAIPKDAQVAKGWYSPQDNLVILVMAYDGGVKWTRARGVLERVWDLRVAHFVESQRLLFIHSSSTTPSVEFARSITDGTAQPLGGEPIFRVLGRVQRLMLQNVGIKKPGRRDLRFSSLSGADVGGALDAIATEMATKAVLRGSGFEAGEKVALGCSVKGKVWAAGGRGTVPEFISWCRELGPKLVDDSIDTSVILKNVLVPTPVEVVPDVGVMALLWPDDLQRRAEDNVELLVDGEAIPFHRCELTLASASGSEVAWWLELGDQRFRFVMTLADQTHRVRQTSGTPVRLEAASTRSDLATYFSKNAPILLFNDGSELEGAFLATSASWVPQPLPPNHLVTWNWSGVDLKTESIWKAGRRRANTIQERAAKVLARTGAAVIFDDDDKGEAADLVTIEDGSDGVLKVGLYHCKFAAKDVPSGDVKQLETVCQQAVRSVRWAHTSSFRRLVRHLRSREEDDRRGGRTTRFLKGSATDLVRFERLSKRRYVETQIFVVQPGVRVGSLTENQRAVVAAANSFVLQTTQRNLTLIGSL